MKSNLGSQGVVVLGPYRSGTSITSKILSTLGVSFGPRERLYVGTRFNPYGYFERDDINDFNNRLIESAGGSLGEPPEPQQLARLCDASLAERLNVDWMTESPLWGIKDPRMCATLFAWLELRLVSRDSLRIVHVVRDLDAATRSGLSDKSIPGYCDGTEEGVRDMLSLYAEYAGWHVANLGVPVHALIYEQLLVNPRAEIDRLAAFIGAQSGRRRRSAYKLVGKKRALRRYWLHRLFVRAPKKVLRILFRIQ